MEIPEPLPWEQRVNGASPLLGGYSGYLRSFHTICERVEQGNLSFEDLVAWMRATFDISETSARLRLAFLRNAGLIHQNDGIVSVDERIRHWMQNGGDDIPIAMMHSRIKFVGEMLSELKEPKSAEALRNAASRYELDWQTYTQIQMRRGWLQSANLIEGTTNLLKLTDAGRHLLSQLKNHVPSENMVPSRPLHRHRKSIRPKPSADEPVDTIDADRLADEIVVASTESTDPGRFEQLVRDAFVQMGFVAKHLGAPGSTDVLLSAPLGKDDSYRVAVDAKTTKSGSLNDNQVDWATLKEHRGKHDADYSLLVAPNPSGYRLMSRAQMYSVAVLSADQLADLCRRHARAPLSLVDYQALFAMTGEVDLTVIDEPTEHLVSLQRLVSVLSDGLSERTDRFGRMSARDVQLGFGEDASGISEDEIQRLLDMLAHPLVGVVHGFRDDGPSGAVMVYVLGTSRDSCARRIRLFADCVVDTKL